MINIMNDRFPENLRRIRKEKGLTLMELAELSGISYQALSKYERNENTPSIAVAEWLCEVFDVSSKELLGF